MKLCPKCGEVGEFYSGDGWCKTCTGIRNRQWAIENPDKIKDRQLRRTYGITLEDYAALLDQQGGVCRLCGKPPSKKSLHVDHCHESGKIRGLLCSKCNTALGLANDSPDLLRRMAFYLEE